jgi:hypothetical protein
VRRLATWSARFVWFGGFLVTQAYLGFWWALTVMIPGVVLLFLFGVIAYNMRRQGLPLRLLPLTVFLMLRGAMTGSWPDPPSN